ncbi:hypothetical protein HPP92_013860 [Vanilla planifolia]|nr:hypothetical protein HPP92_013860 [Vanilla planifolia]
MRDCCPSVSSRHPLAFLDCFFKFGGSWVIGTPTLGGRHYFQPRRWELRKVPSRKPCCGQAMLAMLSPSASSNSEGRHSLFRGA